MTEAAWEEKSDNEIFSKYESELDSLVNFEHYLTKDEYKQIIREDEKVKIIKKIHFKFKDGNSRMIILSKTISLS